MLEIPGNRRHPVAERIGHHRLTTYVLDPVMVATSGDRLLDRDAGAADRAAARAARAPRDPNLNEAEILVEDEVRTPDQMERAGRALVGDGGARRARKSGHLADATTIVDVWVHGRLRRARFTHERIDTTSTHGTGCTLSAAITAGSRSAARSNRQ